MKESSSKDVESIIASLTGPNRDVDAWFFSQLLFATPSEIASVFSIGLDDASVLKNRLQDLPGRGKRFVSLSLAKRGVSHGGGLAISTGSRQLDAALDGGYTAGHIYQFFGRSGSGKSQFCYHFLANLLKAYRQDDLLVAVIDTDLNFQPGRVLQIAGPGLQLERVMVAKCYSGKHMIRLLRETESMIEREQSLRPVVVIDSLRASFFNLPGQESSRRQLLYLAILRLLGRIKQRYHATILFTNPSFGDRYRPAGGPFFINLVDYAISLEKSPVVERGFNAFVVKSPRTPDTRVDFTITPKGIADQ